MTSSFINGTECVYWNVAQYFKTWLDFNERNLELSFNLLNFFFRYSLRQSKILFLFVIEIQDATNRAEIYYVSCKILCLNT